MCMLKEDYYKYDNIRLLQKHKHKKYLKKKWENGSVHKFDKIPDKMCRTILII